MVTVLVAVGGLGAWTLLRKRRRPARGLDDWAERLAPFGLEQVDHRANADFASSDWGGVHEGRGLRLRLLERPGSRSVLFWLRIRFPGRLPPGLRLVWGPLGIERLSVKVVDGGYRLVCVGRNLHDLMGDVELGLPAFDHGGAFGLQASLREGNLEMGCAGSPPARVAADLDALFRLMTSLEAAADEPWRRAAEAHGLSLDEHDAEGHRRLGGEAHGMTCRVALEEGRSVIRVAHGRDLGPIRVVHADLERGEPTGNPLVDMLLGCHGPPERLAELVSDEERVEAILAVVHGHKGSELGPTEVVLRADRDLRWELGDAIGQALDLARAL